MKTLLSILLGQQMRRDNFLAAQQLEPLNKNQLDVYHERLEVVCNQEKIDVDNYFKSLQKVGE